MTAAEQLPLARPTMPNGHLFQSPKGLYPFQAEAVVQGLYGAYPLAVIDRGLGKSVIMCAAAAEAIQQGMVDLVICVGESNKVADKSEFPKDWAEFTSLRVHTYLGGTRVKKLSDVLLTGGVDVVMTTYETGRADLMKRVKTGKSGKGSRTDGPLMQLLGLRGKRVLWLFDEVLKLANRKSELYQAYAYAISQCRKDDKQIVMGLSANPVSADQYEQADNLARLVQPGWMSIGEFEERFTYGRPPGENSYAYRPEAATEFAPMFQRLIFRKRCTDPDVRNLLPELDELPVIKVKLDPVHHQLYQAVQTILGEWDTLDQNARGRVASALRLTAGHPRALTLSTAPIPKAVVEVLGEEFLCSVPSSKTLVLLKELEKLRGHRVLVFTEFADTVLPCLVADLTAAGWKVGSYTGPDRISRANKDAFLAGDLDVLVSSDAGAKGLNMPQVQYVIEYESSSTFENRMQRFGRAQRLGSANRFVYGMTLVAQKTLEVGTLRTVLERNSVQDTLHGDEDAEGYMTAAKRRERLMGV